MSKKTDELEARLEALEKDLIGLRLSVGAQRIQKDCEAGKYGLVGDGALEEAEMRGRRDQLLEIFKGGELSRDSFITWLEMIR